MLIGVLACLGFQFLSIFLFYYFNNILLLVILSAIDYLCLFLRKRCFVKFENKSLFDCKLTRHHQHIKCTEEINDCHKKEDFAKSLKYVYRGSIYKFSFLEFLTSHLVFTTVTWGISRKVKFVDEVGSTVFYKYIFDCHHFFFLCLLHKIAPKVTMVYNYSKKKVRKKRKKKQIKGSKAISSRVCVLHILLED